MTWFLIAVSQEVTRLDNSVVVHAQELAIKRFIGPFMKFR